jgi:hypothetical protein
MDPNKQKNYDRRRNVERRQRIGRAGTVSQPKIERVSKKSAKKVKTTAPVER